MSIFLKYVIFKELSFLCYIFLMTQTEQAKAAKKFSEDWKDKGYEKGESQKFWLDLLCTEITLEAYIVRKTTRIFTKNRTKKNMQMFG